MACPRNKPFQTLYKTLLPQPASAGSGVSFPSFVPPSGRHERPESSPKNSQGVHVRGVPVDGGHTRDTLEGVMRLQITKSSVQSSDNCYLGFIENGHLCENLSCGTSMGTQIPKVESRWPPGIVYTRVQRFASVEYPLPQIQINCLEERASCS